MKKFIVFILFFNYGISQNKSEDMFIGKWKVIEIPNVNNTKNAELKDLKNLFNNAIIEFNSAGDFVLNLNIKSEFASEMNQMTKNTKWKYDIKSKFIMVGTKENNYTVIGFEFFRKNNESYLKLLETEITLKVVKI
jgi:hypothetical protein